MKKEYKEISDFLDDVHNELSIKETIMDMGFVSKDDFKGQFVPCLFHKDGEERTPSLQITDGFLNVMDAEQKVIHKIIRAREYLIRLDDWHALTMTLINDTIR